MSLFLTKYEGSSAPSLSFPTDELASEETYRPGSADASDHPTPGSLVALDAYRRSIGRSKTSIWRYRRRGWLPTVNILGRLYVKRSDISAFETAATNGLLAHPPHGCATSDDGPAQGSASIGSEDQQTSRTFARTPGETSTGHNKMRAPGPHAKNQKYVLHH
jgi:hypothetical protein